MVFRLIVTQLQTQSQPRPSTSSFYLMQRPQIWSREHLQIKLSLMKQCAHQPKLAVFRELSISKTLFLASLHLVTKQLLVLLLTVSSLMDLPVLKRLIHTILISEK